MRATGVEFVAMNGNSGAAKPKQREVPEGKRWQPGESGNPNGRPPHRSVKAHFLEAFDDDARAKAVRAVIRDAQKGDRTALDYILRLVGEQTGGEQPTAINILALIAGRSDGRELLERLFTALPLGASDAGGLGGLLQQERGYDAAGLDAMAAPDADQ